MTDVNYYKKYLKYKAKYFNLKNISTVQTGGAAKTEIYLFKADWCGHCKAFKSVWEKLQQDLSSKYTFITVDADKDEQIIKKWKIQGFPTIIKKVGDKATEYVGQRDEESVKQFIEDVTN